ncbi:hypothetical protein JVU11DRAFT_6480 [Chiua virens]|nr:hypothetical protein JVU11DRAFT_6480 [Chiua virens]
MSTLGSVFLGDFQRNRLLATPPSSPPLSDFNNSTTSMTVPSSERPEPVLETRATARAETNPPSSNQGRPLLHLAADVQRRLTAVVESNDSLKKFMYQYDQHAPLLTPAFAFSGTLPAGAPTYDSMSTDELDALLSEMEPDIRAADRDIREIELLEQSSVLSAGKLADCETLQPRLHALLEAQEQDMRLAATIEKRVAALVERHATHVDTLSELFVAWDDVLTETESKAKQLERDKEERQRLGYT